MKRIVIYVFTAILALCVSCNVEPDIPETNVPGGTYAGAITVSLSCSSRDSRIFYTLDRSNPEYGIEYTEPISITYSCQLRFVAMNKKGCFSATAEEVYGVKGISDGLIFYDCDADNDSTNDGAGPDNLKSSTCGWRYLEAAPEDIKDGDTVTFLFGFYRTSDYGEDLFVNGTTSYVEGTSSEADGKCTGTAIGTGRANTAKLVEAMGSTAYLYSGFSVYATTAKYPAKLCDDYTYGEYDDWFLPSKDELNLMYRNLQMNNLGGFTPVSLVSENYWSSSESAYIESAWSQSFISGVPNTYGRPSNIRVRAVRAFK